MSGAAPMVRVMDLRSTANWDLTGLLAFDVEHLWGGPPRQPIGELAAVLTAREVAAEDEPVVFPAGVDPSTGNVRTRRVVAANRLVFRVRSGSSGARLHDVLVPLAGTSPCVLIGAQHVGLSFTNFALLRPIEPALGLWLWAALSSNSGVRLRRAISTGMASRITLTSLAAAPVPAPPPPHDPIFRALAEVHAATGVSRLSEGRSWWHVTSLPADGQWHQQLATPNPEVFAAGTPLGQLGVIVAGRNPAVSFEHARPGALPVLNGRSVDGRTVTRWADAGAGPPAEPGDIAVVEVGHRGRAAVVDAPAIAGTGVLLVKPHDRLMTPAIARYLRSEPAQALRGMLVTGHIPRLTRSTLAELPVSDDALTRAVSEPAKPRRPLSGRLEQLLWG